MHHRFAIQLTIVILLTLTAPESLVAQEASELLSLYRNAALESGDASRGRDIFESKQTNCNKCHALASRERLAGPDLSGVGDKLTREQLITSVLEPNTSIHPDYAAISVLTTTGNIYAGVLLRRTDEQIELFNSEGIVIKIPLTAVESEKPAAQSLMPADLVRALQPTQFADLIAFLTTLKQEVAAYPGLPTEIPAIANPVSLLPLHSEEMRFAHPVWMIAKPGSQSTFLVVEQQTRQIWELDKSGAMDRKSLFADLSHESMSGQYEGVVCLAFHPQFVENRRYYLNYHVRERGVFTPLIVERLATPDLARDQGGASKRILAVPQPTDVHWGGMLAFGPDDYLYIGLGDAGPQEDPDGHGQDLAVLHGKILRLDVDRPADDLPYGIPEGNPFLNHEHARPEIWAYGFRNPWRFSWDSDSHDLWVGDVGQNLFEEVTIARMGENHGWNVYEGFTSFSDRYRRQDENYTPPVLSYRRREGVSVTGGYVYRGQRSPSFVGAYIFSDFESKRIWALKQLNRQLVMLRQIGTCPEQPVSFGIDPDGELLIVGYEGTLFRLVLDDSVFE